MAADRLGHFCPGCDAASAEFTRTAPDDLQIPESRSNPSLAVPIPKNLQNIGDFEVIEKLGQGGMGAVYKARQISLGRMVALKILPQQYEDDADYVSRFQREAALAANLNHANLVRVYQSGYADGCHFIAMELVEGENLRQLIKRGPVTLSDGLRIVADVARGLQCGWDKAQLIHRDIKPSNIYIARNGDVKLGDLGLAKSMLANTTGLTQTGAAMGTALYMSPEQIRGEKNLDFRADIYSLGCTLFELLTGKPPYEGTDQMAVLHKHLNAPLPAILKAIPNCPMPLVKLMGKMLKKNRPERHSSYEDLIAEIEWVKDKVDGAVSATQYRTVPQTAPTNPPAPSAHVATPRVPPGSSSGARAFPRLWIGIAAGVLVLGIVAFVLMKQPGRARVSRAGSPSNASSLPSLEPAPVSPKAVTEPPAPLAAPKSAGATATSDPSSANFAGHRYELVLDRTASWADAKAKAAQRGGYLARIESRAEHDFLMRTFVSPRALRQSFWIDGVKAGENQPWILSDGQTLQPFDWTTPSPDVGNRDQGAFPAFLSYFKTREGQEGMNDFSDTAAEHTHWQAISIGYLVEWDGGTAP